jgi:hypothetical protein
MFMRHMAFLGMVGLLGWAAVASAQGSLSVNFGNPVTKNYTANQHAKMSSFIARFNAQRAASDPPQGAVTIEQYVANRCEQIMIDDIQQAIQDDALDGCEMYWTPQAQGGISDAVRTQIRAALGGKDPCTDPTP